MEIHEMSAALLIDKLSKRELSPVEVVDAHLDRIHKLNSELNAFITIDDEGALKAAREAEKHPQGPLFGLPVGIKDLSYTKGLRTTCGSLTLKDNVPSYDSISVERVRQAGGIVIGKTNTPEFGYKAVTDNRVMPPCVNPWDHTKTSGGSSGGSACAVAAHMIPLAEGTDGAGSIRVPASFCGVVGFKPSFAAVPRYPIPDLFYSLSHTGPIARNVEDASILFEVLQGQDIRDSLSFNVDPAPSAEEMQGLRLAWYPGLSWMQAEPEVAEICSKAAHKYTELGHRVEEACPQFPDPEQVELNIWETVYASRYAPMTPEFRELLTPEMAEIIERGMLLPTYQYSQDSIQRTKVYYTMVEFFKTYDALLIPTLPIPAFDVNKQRPESVNGTPITTLFGWTPYTYPFNLTGQPALTLPVGKTQGGLPVGLQIIANRGADRKVLKLAAALEEALG